MVYKKIGIKLYTIINHVNQYYFAVAKESQKYENTISCIFVSLACVGRLIIPICV